jgi:hypothetical protein
MQSAALAIDRRRGGHGGTSAAALASSFWIDCKIPLRFCCCQLEADKLSLEPIL